jgi:hypothetical protein
VSRQTKTRRAGTITPSTPTFEQDYLDIDHWPYGWRVEPRDLLPGQRMLDIFKMFLESGTRSQDLASAS